MVGTRALINTHAYIYIYLYGEQIIGITQGHGVDNDRQSEGKLAAHVHVCRVRR